MSDLHTSSIQSDSPDEPRGKFDLQILRYLRRIMRSVDLYSSKLKANYQITAPQLICLLAITENGPLTATHIAGQIHLSASTVVGILDRLEKKGLIRRVRDQKDKRQVIIAATDKGDELARHAPSPLQEDLARALNQLSDLEQATIALSLQRIVEMMETEDFKAAPILETGHLVNDEPEAPNSSPPL